MTDSDGLWFPPSLCSIFGIDDAIIAAIIGGGAILGSSALSSNAAGKAAGAIDQSAAAATAEQRRQFDTGRSDQQPWLVTGKSALDKLAALYGLDTVQPAPAGASGMTAQTPQGGGEAPGIAAARSAPPNGPGNNSPIQDISQAIALGRTITDAQWAQAGYGPGGSAQGGAGAQAPPPGVVTPAAPRPAAPGAPGGAEAGPYGDFFKSPDYQFRVDESLKQYDAHQAAAGLYDSGATRKGVAERVGNLASGEFSSYANRLATLAGVGQTTATNLAGQGQNYANQVGQNAMWAGDNRASSYVAQGNTYANTLSTLGGVGQGYFQNRNNSGYANFNPNSGQWNPGRNGFPVQGYS